MKVYIKQFARKTLVVAVVIFIMLNTGLIVRSYFSLDKIEYIYIKQSFTGEEATKVLNHAGIYAHQPYAAYQYKSLDVSTSVGGLRIISWNTIQPLFYDVKEFNKQGTGILYSSGTPVGYPDILPDQMHVYLNKLGFIFSCSRYNGDRTIGLVFPLYYPLFICLLMLSCIYLRNSKGSGFFV